TLPRAVRGGGGGYSVGALRAALQRDRRLQGTVISYVAMAQGEDRFHGQARRRYWHRGDRGSAHPAWGEGMRASDGLSAHAQLLRPAPQRPGQRGNTAALEGELRRDRSQMPRESHRLSLRFRPA